MSKCNVVIGSQVVNISVGAPISYDQVISVTKNEKWVDMCVVFYHYQRNNQPMEIHRTGVMSPCLALPAQEGLVIVVHVSSSAIL